MGKHKDIDIFWIVGKYGPYLKYGKQNIALPKELKGLEVKPTLEQAVDLIEGKNKK